MDFSLCRVAWGTTGAPMMRSDNAPESRYLYATVWYVPFPGTGRGWTSVAAAAGTTIRGREPLRAAGPNS